MSSQIDRTLKLALLLFAASSCEGTIGDPSGRMQGGGGPGAEGAICAEDPDPGRVTVHRLNRAEFDNTIRDLIGLDLQVARDFPADDSGYGFDNIADVLAVSPLLVEKYEAAAARIVDAAMGAVAVDAAAQRFEAEDVGGDVGGASGGAWNLWSSGSVSQVVGLPADGSYVIRAHVWADQAGGELAHMTLRLDALEVGGFDVSATAGAGADHEVEVTATAGAHLVAVSVGTDYYDQASGADRNLYVDWFEVEGPMDAAPEGGSVRDRIVTCDPAVLGEEPCAREILGGFARRAWRRPVDATELDPLLGLLTVAREEGDGFEVGIRLALQAVLLSPHFLFRIELDPDPASGDKHPLGDHELASRLSYFLWSSMPDEELFAAADAGLLQDPEELERQVRRMIADGKAQALTHNFASQWLYTRNLAAVTPNTALYPAWSDELRADFRAETEAFFQSLLEDGSDVRELLTADHSFLNERLAAFYGVPGVPGPELRRVELPDGPRAGLFGQGAWLTVTSHPSRTSPVKRGKWVLANLLCQEPPPPPANVPALEEGDNATGSVRQRMEQHRSDPVCAGCHSAMDPIGFGLENFDPIGEWRTDDGGYPIDATGTLLDGTSFDGPRELAAALHDDPALPDCVASRIFVYALGRGEIDADECDLEAIASDFADSGYRLDELLVRVATSDAFRMRRGERPDEASAPETGGEP